MKKTKKVINYSGLASAIGSTGWGSSGRSDWMRDGPDRGSYKGPGGLSGRSGGARMAPEDLHRRTGRWEAWETSAQPSSRSGAAGSHGNC